MFKRSFLGQNLLYWLIMLTLWGLAPGFAQENRPDMVLVAAGSYQRFPEAWLPDLSRPKDTSRVKTKTVLIERNFFIMRFEISFAQYDEYCTAQGLPYTDDKGWGRGDRPAINISWYDAVNYANWLSQREGLTPCYTSGAGGEIRCDFKSDGYRLPTEAEWEWAALGGRLSQGYYFAGADEAGLVGWFVDNSAQMTHPLGQRSPNELGLYDMSGNVWEWCWDYYAPGYYTSSPDPTGPAAGTFRSFRGGGWGNTWEFLLRTTRCYGGPFFDVIDVGFRLVRTSPAY